MKGCKTYALNNVLSIMDIDFTENPQFVIVHGRFIDTYISKLTLKISFRDKNDTVLCQDFEATGKKGNNIFVSKANDCIAYYGFGENVGKLNKKGCYMKIFNTDDGNYFDMGNSNSDMIFFGATDGKIQYYFIPGNDIKAVIKNYSKLTGTMHLPPAWSLGYQQCRYSYASQNEVTKLAQTFKKKSIPCDTIYLDIDYMENYKVMTFNKAIFPNPKEMISNLDDQCFKLVTILDPEVKVDEDYFLYKSGIQNNSFVKNKDGELYQGEVWPGISAFPYFTNEDSRK